MMNRTPDILTANAEAMERATSDLDRVREEIGKVIIGQRDVIDGVLTCPECFAVGGRSHP